MFIFLPALCFLFVFLSIYKGGRQNTFCRRGSFLLASLVLGVLVVVSTELLSLFYGVRFNFVLAFWITAALLSGWIYFSTSFKEGKIPPSPINLVEAGTGFLKKLSSGEIILLSSIILIVATLGLTAFIAPTNNWDSMTYHMSRVMHWIQNRSVCHFPAHIQRQVYLNPFAEFVIMHLVVLGGGRDLFANFVQWFCMVGSVLGVSLIAKQLGANRLGQIVSSVVAVTIPMGVLQSVSTQNDHVVSFGMVCFVHLILRIKEDGIRWPFLLGLGASLGLAILTKATGYIYGFSFFLWLVVILVKKLRWKLWKPLLIISGLIICINAGQYARNLNVYGKPIFSGGDTYLNRIFTPQALVSNAFKNLSLHLSTPGEKVRGAMTAGIQSVDAVLGIEKNDSRITWGEFKIPEMSTNEDVAGNLMHAVLFCVLFVICMVRRDLRREEKLLPYFFTLIGSFILFCYLLKWQMFHSRLHLPLFVLFSPISGVVLTKIKNKKIIYLIVIILIMGALPYVLCNEKRPLIAKRNIFNTKRTDQYFIYQPGRRRPYMETVNFLHFIGCSDIGLIMGEDSWEYPFWVLLNEGVEQKARLKHVNVNNLTSKAASFLFEDYTPCAIITFDEQKDKAIKSQGHMYTKAWGIDYLNVFLYDKTGELQKKSSLFYLDRSLMYSTKVISLINAFDRSQGAKMSGDVKKIILTSMYYLKLTENINIEQLNTLYPGFGDHYKDYFINGLKLYVHGLKTANEAQHNIGHKMMLRWLVWLTEHRSSLQQITDEE